MPHLGGHAGLPLQKSYNNKGCGRIKGKVEHNRGSVPNDILESGRELTPSHAKGEDDGAAMRPGVNGYNLFFFLHK